MVELSVVVPVFNEEESLDHLLPRLVQALEQFGRSWEVVLVDDGSTDGSWEKLRAWVARQKGLRAIRLRRNFGQTAAMSAGFHHARGRLIITLDADLQNDPNDIPLLVETLERQSLDVVSGWRKERQDPFLTRRLPSQLANALISRFTGVRLHDYGCTLKVYRREVIENLSLYGEMHRFLPALASWVGGSIGEVVVHHHPRRFGRSKYGLSRTTRVILDLLTVNFLLRYSTRPIQIFGRWGLGTLFTGLVLLAVMAIPHLLYPFFKTHWIEMLVGLAKRPFWVTTPFMLIFFGIQFISMGLLAELQTRTYHESQRKPVYTVRDILDSTPPAQEPHP
jgi:glycosyltransferase involved in cell wall biosynthesis